MLLFASSADSWDGLCLALIGFLFALRSIVVTINLNGARKVRAHN